MLLTTIFFDIGGVLLTDGWDHNSRRAAAANFDLDWDEYNERHEKVGADLDLNRLTLEQYLEFAVFYRPRAFTREQFRAFMFAQSQAKPETIEIAKLLAESRKYLMAVISNEVMELNVYRLKEFGLRQYFSAFFSSCFMGMRKPDEAIYRAALQIVQRSPEESLFIDDREVNLEAPRKLGMRTIQFQDASALRAALRELGVAI